MMSHGASCHGDLTNLVVDAEADDLCEEGAGEVGRDVEVGSERTLKQTFADHSTGKVIVVRCDDGRMVRIWMNLGRCVCVCVFRGWHIHTAYNTAEVFGGITKTDLPFFQ